MEFGKRVPKRKSSCCSSCTLSHDGRERSQKRRRIFNSETERNKHAAKSKRSTRKTCFPDEGSSITPAEWLSDISALESVSLLEKPDTEVFPIFLKCFDSGIGPGGLEISDLYSLIGNNNLSLAVIRKIENILNRHVGSKFCFNFNDFLADEKGMTQAIQSKCPVSQLIMYCCVDKDEDEDTFFVDISDDNCKSHYTLAVFDFDSLSVMYGDTLGWNIPLIFIEKLKELLSNLGCPSLFYTVLCHPPNDNDCHTCDAECSPIYPIQSCDTVSGLAVCVCMAIAFINYDAYLSLVMGISNGERHSFHYLQDVTNHSKLLRLVICSWVINDCVNFNNIASNLNNIASCDELPETGKSLGYRKPFSNSLLKETKQSPSVSGLNIKTEPDPMSRVFQSPKGLEELIACRPVIHFCKPDHFRLKITMKDGRCLYKMFKCTGKDDQEAMYVITEFLSTSEVIDWVKSKTFRNASVIPNTRLRKNKTCNILDFPDDVQGYFIKNPELSFERKIRYLVLRIYIRGCPSVITKKFRCTAAGKHDGSAIKRINCYINSKEFWDLVVNNARSVSSFADNLHNADFHDLVLRKPIIHHIKERSILKLECQLRTGRRIYRGFACSSAGKGDFKTMAVIQKFLQSKEAADWVRSKYEIKLDKKKTQKQKITNKLPKDDWIADGELSVGFMVKNFFDKLDFDFRKRVVMAKGVQSLYEGSAIITENEKWGKTHRFDETYMLNDPGMSDKGSFPAVTMYISCSSKSSYCRAQCGTPLKNLANTAIGSECPACQSVLEFPTKECISCSTSSTPKWYSLNGEFTCSACYQYQVKHNDSRPTELKMKSAQGVSRLYHSHFACGWRLKLVIYSNNLSTWKLFKHKDNDDFHTPHVEEIDKKPDVSMLPTVIVAKPSKSQKVIIRNDSKSILCSRCIAENSSAPFVCTSQTELMKHISLSHKINLMNCATCWSESGSIITFENEHDLQHHIQENHKDDQQYHGGIDHDRENEALETNGQVELDEAVIALLEPSPM